MLSELDLNLNFHSYKPLRKQIYELLRESILAGKLKPGQKISEQKIAGELNVSRTPVREAIQLLESEDLVAIVPKRGVFIAGIKSRKEIDDIFQVRVNLEGLAAFLTAKNIQEQEQQRIDQFLEEFKTDPEKMGLERCIEIDVSFHQFIYDTADNIWLKKMLDNLLEQINRFRASSFSQQGRMMVSLKEHIELAEAFKNKDPETAKTLARKHVENARGSIIRAFEEVYEEE